ncbi:MAG: hypothetical protein KC479_13710, partial [Dehalococcoidia bacterium]|nr:hypothetical protein [Dehalococcoidia bacterium]
SMTDEIRRLVLAGVAMVAIGTLGAAWSATELADGVVEIPDHWWSTLLTAPLAVGLAVLIMGLLRGTLGRD